ncbi:MAG: hypothetical protein KGL39_05545 [Patescibacteria group bacterium]|nr:hypothetical protein [Patescibacteria group bacterium]
MDAKAKVDERYIIERNGKPFVLYAGLLDLAHMLGLQTIKTTLLQIPSTDNGETAIVYAEVTITDHGTYTGLGDANPGNVSAPMRPHIIRLAETRAKARALRDAVNVGTVALEELGDADEGEQPRAPVLPISKPEPATAATGSLVTPAQLRYIENLERETGMDDGMREAKRTKYGGEAMTKAQATAYIEWLKFDKGVQAASRESWR